MANQIQLRRDTAANWTTYNPVLHDGEPGLEIDTFKIKYGDGLTAWNSLPYLLAGSVPEHEWDGTELRFRNPNGTWGTWVDVYPPNGPGLAALKDWDATYTYAVAEATFRNGVPYKSLIAGNINNDPESNPDKWEITGGGGAGGSENFLANDLTKANLTGVTNTGATSVAWDAAATSVLNAGALKAIFPASGTGRVLDIALNDLDPNQVGQTWLAKFSYKLGTNADDLVSAFLYDGTVEIPLALSALPYAGGLLQNAGGAVLPTTQLTGVKLRFKFKDNTAITFYLADVSVGPYSPASGGAIGEWQSYTPTFTGFGTPTVVSVKQRRVGSSLAGLGTFTTGTVTAAAGSLSLPVGLTNALDMRRIVGKWWRDEAVSNTVKDGALVADPATGIIYFSTESYPNNYSPFSIILSLSALIASSQKVSFMYDIPIAQWTANVNLDTDFQEFAFNTEPVVNTNDIDSFGHGSEGTPILSNTSATYYDVQFKRPIQPTDVLKVEVRSKVNGEWVNIQEAGVESLFFASMNHQFFYVGSTAYQRGIILTRISSNVVRVRFLALAANTIGSWADSSAGATRTWAAITAASDGYDRWRVRKISNGNMAEVPALVKCQAFLNAAAAVGAGAPVLFNTVLSDSHNGYVPTTGRYYAKVPGRYSISGQAYTLGTATGLMLYKNGNPYCPACGISSSMGTGFSVQIDLVDGDYIDLRPVAARTLEGGATLATSNTHFQISRLGS